MDQSRPMGGRTRIFIFFPPCFFFGGVEVANFFVAEVQLARRPPFQPLRNAKAHTEDACGRFSSSPIFASAISYQHLPYQVRCWDLAMVALAARIARLAATQEA